MLLGGVLCSTSIAAQTDSIIRWRDFSYIRQVDARLTNNNAAGLKYLPVGNISRAEIYANKKKGDFVNYHQSKDDYTLGAEVESFYRLDPQIVFYGKVSYSNFEGKKMGGSTMIDPYYNPFDIIENADSTRGDKKLETYNLVGAVSADIYKGLTLGAKIDYKSANYAKFKDLRHVNKLMDMHVTAGLSYPINKSVEIGANYYYRRSTEELRYKIHGLEDRTYESLISYGVFWGILETFGGRGYADKEYNQPIFNEFHGGSLQLNYKITPQFNFFNELTYKQRDGYYGIRSSSRIVYSEHNSNIWEYNATFSFSQQQNKHILQLSVDNEKLENFENIHEEKPKPNDPSTSIVYYYGDLKVLDRDLFNAKVDYTAYLGVKDFNPTWILNAGARFMQRKQTASIYPYYRKQTLRYNKFYLFAVRNIERKMDMYSPSFGLSYQSGSGNPKQDGLYATPSTGGKTPKSSDLNLFREYEYFTNKQFEANIGFKYSRIFPQLAIKGYASVNYSMTKASDITYLSGDNRHTISFVIGCNF